MRALLVVGTVLLVVGLMYVLRPGPPAADPPPGATRTVLNYGPETDQHGELWLPDADGPFPVVVLVHGGFWGSQFGSDLMDALAADVVRHGWAAWNIEYRRVGGDGGWPETFEDNAAALDHLALVAGRFDLDLDRVATVGHSAGGHLALWLAGRQGLPEGAPGSKPVVRPVLAVSQAGVADLRLATSDGTGSGAVESLMGGGPSEFPDRYDLGSPAELLPLGVPSLLVHGESDPLVPIVQSRSFLEQAEKAGDTVRLVALPGGHFEHLDPASSGMDRRDRRAWRRVRRSRLSQMSSTAVDRIEAERLDSIDPIEHARAEFLIDEGGPIYLDGHSLGRLPLEAQRRVSELVDQEWGSDLVRGWERWVDWPQRLGDRLGSIALGAGPGQVVVCDSTTVNLYKVAGSVISARVGDVVTERTNFPTDRYVLQGLSQTTGRELRYFDVDFDAGLDLDVVARAAEGAALVVISLVDFRSSALAPMKAVNDACRAAGALVCWDLSHAVGAVEIDLDGTGADLAVGCTYKYLNAGPGAPAFVYVSRQLQAELRQPIWGWFGQADQFVMAHEYGPVAGIGQHLTGTPPILGLAALEGALSVLEAVGVGPVREKGTALVDFGLRVATEIFAGTEADLAGPRDAALRGSHLTFRVGDAETFGKRLAEANVLGDVRPPDLIRFGLAPAYTRFVDVWDALDRTRELLHTA